MITFERNWSGLYFPWTCKYPGRKDFICRNDRFESGARKSAFDKRKSKRKKPVRELFLSIKKEEYI